MGRENFDSALTSNLASERKGKERDAIGEGQAKELLVGQRKGKRKRLRSFSETRQRGRKGKRRRKSPQGKKKRLRTNTEASRKKVQKTSSWGGRREKTPTSAFLKVRAGRGKGVNSYWEKGKR